VGTEGDLSSSLAWRRSLRASQARRSVRSRCRRLTARGCAGLILAALATALPAGGALAAQGPEPPGRIRAASVDASSNRGSIRALQRALHLPADGVYGARTRAAVRRFQRRHGLTVDGIAGPETLAELGLSDDAGDTRGDAPPASDTTGDPALDASTRATLDRIAQCESGGDPAAVSADGQYRGKYQFDQATWERLGGTGDPAAASAAEQDRIAAKLLARSGTSPWPACG
jgi:peptidoglycan hydrolase-like protein with peptidoglycan-binding domain